MNSNAQDSIPVSNQELQYDLDTNLTPPNFDIQKLEDFKTDEDFNYVETPQTENWWTRLKKWVNQLWRDFIKSLFGVDEIGGFLGVIIGFLPYLILVGVLALIVWLFMKVSPKELLMEKHSIPEVILTEEEDIIQNQDIDTLISKAIQQANYRLAIRYYYLKVLKSLTDQELIHWEAQKTNHEYYDEIPNQQLKTQFTTITNLYDFIWYGSFDIDQTIYLKAEKEFKVIHHLIHS